MPPVFREAHRVRDALLYNEMYASIHAYATPGAYLPTNLNALVAFAVQNSGRRPTFVSTWTSFIYVSNVREDDPPGTPLVIEVPLRDGKHQYMVGMWRGGAEWLSKDQVEELIVNPWLRIEHKFKDEAALADFKKRVRVIYPHGYKGPGGEG